MRKAKDVLRLKLDALLSHEPIAPALNISKGVVAMYASLAAAAGLDWPTVSGLDEARLQRRLLNPTERLKTSHFARPDYGPVHQELRRQGITPMLLWEEHVTQHPRAPTHGHPQFCENNRRSARTLKRSLRQIHRTGEKLFNDLAGPRVACATAPGPQSSLPRWAHRATPSCAPRRAKACSTG